MTAVLASAAGAGGGVGAGASAIGGCWRSACAVFRAVNAAPSAAVAAAAGRTQAAGLGAAAAILGLPVVTEQERTLRRPPGKSSVGREWAGDEPAQSQAIGLRSFLGDRTR